MRNTLGVPVILWITMAMCLIITMVLFIAPVIALADGDATITDGIALTNEPTETPVAPYTWELLATTAGATAATLLIVQFLKLPLDKIWKIPTRVFVLGIAFALMAGAQAIIRGLTWPDVPLVLVNAFVVALAAMGAYEVSFAKLGA